MIKAVKYHIEALRKAKPLILNITNFVTMDLVANALLALGAAPLMTTSDEELEELVLLANAVVINIGTLDTNFIQRCQKATQYARKHKKSLILDPAGAGASLIRTETAKSLLQYADIVKGNPSEIYSLLNQGHQSLGVESLMTVADAKNSARNLATQYNFTVVVTGAQDFITNGSLESEVPYGSSLMSLITGAGCSLTATIAAFKAVSADSFESAHHATFYFGLCGQLASKHITKPGSFRAHFLDELFAADFDKMTNNIV